MALKEAVKQGISLLMNPEREFHNVSKQTLEDILGKYMQLLLVSGLVAGIFSFLYSLGRAVFLQGFKQITVDYLRMMNYAAGISTGTFFFYLFVGTFIVFIISILLNIFLRHVSYTDTIKILCCSLAPLLLFSWIARATVFPLAIWSVFLIIVGIRNVPVPTHDAEKNATHSAHSAMVKKGNKRKGKGFVEKSG